MRSLYLCTWLVLIGIGVPTDIVVTGVCELPDAWAGSWYENGVRQTIQISGPKMSHKGTCVKSRHSTQFIFKDNISVDEPLKTMFRMDAETQECPIKGNSYKYIYLFRMDAETQECPIKGHYTFSYSRGYGECLYPLSSLSHCGNATSLIFSSRRMSKFSGAGRSIPYQTLYTYNPDNYLAQMVPSMSRYQGNRERCQDGDMYSQSVYTGYELAMSAAGECNLYSATEGQTTFNLKRVREPERGCKYPEWAKEHSAYMSLHGSTHIHIDHQKSILTLSWSGFQCVELERVSDDVMILRVGKITFSPEDACSPNLYFSQTKPVLITGVDIKRKSCPLSGQYRISQTKPNQEDTTSTKSADHLNQGKIIYCNLKNLNKPSVNTPIITAAAVKDQRVAASAASAVTATDEVDPLAGSSSGSDAKCPSVVSSCGNPYTLSFSNQCTNYGKEYTCYDSWHVPEGKMIILSPTNNSLNRFCILLREGKDRFNLEVVTQCTPPPQATNNNSVNFQAVHYGDCSPTALATANHASTVSACLIHIIIILFTSQFREFKF